MFGVQISLWPMGVWLQSGDSVGSNPWEAAALRELRGWTHLWQPRVCCFCLHLWRPWPRRDCTQNAQYTPGDTRTSQGNAVLNCPTAARTHRETVLHTFFLFFLHLFIPRSNHEQTYRWTKQCYIPLNNHLWWEDSVKYGAPSSHPADHSHAILLIWAALCHS